MGGQSVFWQTQRIENQLTYEGEQVLSYRIGYPVFAAERERPGLVPINRFYRERALRYQRACETELYDAAMRRAREDRACGVPVRAFEAALSFRVTLAGAHAVSLYLEQYRFTSGAHGETEREARTWNLCSGGMVRAHQIFLCEKGYKAYILSRVKEQISAQPEACFSDWDARIRTQFQKNSFYCTEEGVTVFYRPYEIAPYAAGFPEFGMPYSACVQNPETICRGA